MDYCCTGYLQSSGELNTDNFSYVEMNVQGEASTAYVFGIGGLSKKTLVNEAKQDLLKKHPLKDNQALVNVIVEFRLSYAIGMVQKRTCTISADIVQFK